MPPGTPQFLNHWGRCLTDVGRYEEAKAQLKAAYDGELEMRGAEHMNTREAIANLVYLYEAWGKPEEATTWRAKCPPRSRPQVRPDWEPVRSDRRTRRVASRVAGVRRSTVGTRW